MGEITQETGKKGLGKKARIALASLAAIGVIEAAGAVTTELTNNQPASITRTVPDDLKWPATLIENLMNQKVPEAFINPHEGKIKFGENNIARISTEEANKKNLLEPKIRIDSDGKAVISSLLPGIFPSSIQDTDLNIENHADKEQTPYTHATFIMPEGYKLTLPKGTHYALFEADKVPNQQPDLVYTIVGFYYDAKSDVSLILSFETGGFKPEPNQKIITNGTYPEFSPSRGGNFAKLPESDGVTPIASPTTSNQKLNIHIDAIKGQITPSKSLQEAQSKSLKSLWENFTNQNQKLILISSK